MVEQKDVIELHKPCCDNLNYFHKGYCLFCSKTKLTEYPCKLCSNQMTVMGYCDEHWQIVKVTWTPVEE